MLEKNEQISYSIDMELKDYLKKHNLNAYNLAAMLKLSHVTVYNWLKGVRPHKRLAKKVEHLTKGEVSLEDLGHDNT